jgi:hypothetical protein
MHQAGKRLAEHKNDGARQSPKSQKAQQEPKCQSIKVLGYSQKPIPVNFGLYSSANENHEAVEVAQEQTFLSALFENGTILGITCGSSFPSKSKPAGLNVPVSLLPTILQLSTVHWQWIDRFPFPDARDEMIIQSCNINEEEFLWDLFHMETFRLRPGSKPWDPTAFAICIAFWGKWGFLFPSFASTVLTS